jgi:predicted O-methyltransferase YrrM
MTKEQFETHVSNLSPQTVGEMHYGHFENFTKMVQIAKPSSILELGFNRGVSALMWLFNTPDECKLHSIDLRSKETVSKSLEYINGIFGDRFKYSHLDHSVLTEDFVGMAGMVDQYDLIFIDGDHTYQGILRDTENVLRMNPKYIAFDDYFHRAHGHDTQRVIKQFGLEVIEEYRVDVGQAITKNPHYKS